MNFEELLQRPLREVLQTYPYLRDFFAALAISLPNSTIGFGEFLAGQDTAKLEEFSLGQEELRKQCAEFINQMELFKVQGDQRIREITVKAGYDKNGQAEKQDLILRTGEVVCVVGPTGSGKSRLLADIECLAQADTPSGRSVLLDGQAPDQRQRLSGEQQLVAQLSQNMNFVMDLSVEEFITMHAESRLVVDIEHTVEQVYTTAVSLAGESFSRQTPVTALSGGQSRALMIADVACLSRSPIVLIDEIENAGVDRRQALQILVQEEKIVLIATHDPLLALSGDRRLVIRNGGVASIIETSEEERQGLLQLAELDHRLNRLREQVRAGERLDFDLQQFFQ
ncbi:ATP-binding cassette domain-containing protein [Desulfogranum japonicum]|uniref:ATP-binding cassette domain-containing protein n=1 Tax=Desulfogranum japonicum TaxID=231447 RepID=UPI000420F311|nr:ATP-binding cassette domain-containing protein [Desulfogranum japonicum]